MAVRNLYDVTARLMDGPTVVGYQVKSTGGAAKNVTREQACYLVGKGNIQNVKGAISNGDIILQGVGVRLDSLPVIKVKDPKKRKVAPAVETKAEVSAHIPKQEKVAATSSESKSLELDRATVASKFYTNGNRQQIVDFLIPSIYNQLWRKFRLADKNFLKSVQTAIVELDKRLNESMILSAVDDIDLEMLSIDSGNESVMISFIASMLTRSGLMHSFVDLFVTSGRTFKADISFSKPSSDGITRQNPGVSQEITPATTAEEINSHLSSAYNSKIKLTKWGRTTANKLGVAINAAPLVALIEIPDLSKSSFNVGVQLDGAAIASKYYTNGNRQQITEFLIPSVINELWENLAISDKALNKAVQSAIIELDKKLNESMLISAVDHITTQTTSNTNTIVEVSFIAGLFGVTATTIEGIIPASISITAGIGREPRIDMRYCRPCGDGATWHTPQFQLLIGPETTAENIIDSMRVALKSEIKLSKWGGTDARDMKVALNVAPTVSLVETPDSIAEAAAKAAAEAEAQNPSKQLADFKNWLTKYYYNIPSQRQFQEYLLDELIGQLDRAGLTGDQQVAKALTILLGSLFNSLNMAVLLRKDIDSLKLSTSEGKIGLKLSGGIFATNAVIPFEYNVIQSGDGDAAIRLKLWKPDRETKHLAGDYTLMVGVDNPENVEEVLNEAMRRWNVSIVPFDGI